MIWPAANWQGVISLDYKNYLIQIYELNGDWEWEIAIGDRVVNSGADPDINEAKRNVELFFEGV